MARLARLSCGALSGFLVNVDVRLFVVPQLRYPSYPLAHWKFPGVGEFQCYDRVRFVWFYRK